MFFVLSKIAIILFCLFSFSFLKAQNQPPPPVLKPDSLLPPMLRGIFEKPLPKPVPKDSLPKAWQIGAGLGLDFSQLLLINPRIGAGENRLGIGGNSSAYARYRKQRWAWNNEARLQFGIQRLGRGNQPFQKNLDEFRVNSAIFYAINRNKPIAYALDALFITQITPTYQGNLLSPPAGMPSQAIARWLAPASFNLSPGLAYKPRKNLSVLLAPASLKIVLVADDAIARQASANGNASLHGNPLGRFPNAEAFRRVWRRQPQGQIGDSIYYARSDVQFGATLRLNYSNKFFPNLDKKNHRLAFTTALTLYSNYLRDPQNIDVDWTTTTDFHLVKGLAISLNTNLFYDHDVLVQLDRDRDLSTGVNGYESTGRRVSLTQTLLIKYNLLF